MACLSWVPVSGENLHIYHHKLISTSRHLTHSSALHRLLLATTSTMCTLWQYNTIAATSNDIVSTQIEAEVDGMLFISA